MDNNNSENKNDSNLEALMKKLRLEIAQGSKGSTSIPPIECKQAVNRSTRDIDKEIINLENLIKKLQAEIVKISELTCKTTKDYINCTPNQEHPNSEDDNILTQPMIECDAENRPSKEIKQPTASDILSQSPKLTVNHLTTDINDFKHISALSTDNNVSDTLNNVRRNFTILWNDSPSASHSTSKDNNMVGECKTTNNLPNNIKSKLEANIDIRSNKTNKDLDLTHNKTHLQKRQELNKEAVNFKSSIIHQIGMKSEKENLNQPTYAEQCSINKVLSKPINSITTCSVKSTAENETKKIGHLMLKSSSEGATPKCTFKNLAYIPENKQPITINPEFNKNHPTLSKDVTLNQTDKIFDKKATESQHKLVSLEAPDDQTSNLKSSNIKINEMLESRNEIMSNTPNVTVTTKNENMFQTPISISPVKTLTLVLKTPKKVVSSDSLTNNPQQKNSKQSIPLLHNLEMIKNLNEIISQKINEESKFEKRPTLVKSNNELYAKAKELANLNSKPGKPIDQDNLKQNPNDLLKLDDLDFLEKINSIISSTIVDNNSQNSPTSIIDYNLITNNINKSKHEVNNNNPDNVQENIEVLRKLKSVLSKALIKESCSKGFVDKNILIPQPTGYDVNHNLEDSANVLKNVWKDVKQALSSIQTNVLNIDTKTGSNHNNIVSNPSIDMLEEFSDLTKKCDEKQKESNEIDSDRLNVVHLTNNLPNKSLNKTWNLSDNFDSSTRNGNMDYEQFFDAEVTQADNISNQTDSVSECEGFSGEIYIGNVERSGRNRTQVYTEPAGDTQKTNDSLNETQENFPYESNDVLRDMTSEIFETDEIDENQ